MTLENIPEELQTMPRWICWKKIDRAGGKPAKVPLSVNGGPGKVNDPATWATFPAAVEMSTQEGSGVGFVFTNTEYIGIDIDGCIDPDSGQLSKKAAWAVKRANSYTEVSQSGRGIHIILHGKLPEGRRRRGAFEMYGSGSPRYFALTGDIYGEPKPIRADQGAIDDIHRRFIADKSPKPERPASPTFSSPQGGGLEDEQIILLASTAKDGKKFSDLYAGNWRGVYNSQSEADLALCNLLAFWTGRDAAQMDRIFRSSGLMRPKWDERHGGSSYGGQTIERAANDCGRVYDPAQPVPDAGPMMDGEGRTLQDYAPDRARRYGWNDMGNGYLFADFFKDRARFCPERKKWYLFDGRRWALDVAGLAVMELCKQLADALLFYALTLDDPEKRDGYIKHVHKWQGRKYRETIVKDAASVYPVALHQMDANPYLFNCINGTLDLETGVFYDHRAGDMLSRLAGVSYDPDAPATAWESFVDQVMEGDQEKAGFFQKALGYALTGDTRQECFFILYGATSRNGKGTAMETMQKLMGDYGRTARPETIAQRQTAAAGNSHSEDIARLAGARFVNISEPDKRLTLSAALVKSLTGNDTITARFLNENSFEYRPQFKLFINTNYLPTVTDVTLFTSERVKVIPFERHFSDEEQDKGLKSRLQSSKNLSGLLNWCIAGWEKLQEAGLKVPTAVRVATEAYRDKSDKLRMFLSETTERDPRGEVLTTVLYSKYRDWCYLNGYYPENMANFKAAVSEVDGLRVVRDRPNGAGKRANPVALIRGIKLDGTTVFVGPQ